MHLEGSYNYSIVALSVIIAILASYSALNIAAKIRYSSGNMRYFWLLSGALVMGSGVWSMHFVGMLAFHLHMKITYDSSLTLLSMVSSVVSSLIAFYITMPENIKWHKLAIGGFIMGSGIVVMHYTGMAAMIMPMEVSYNQLLFVLSVVIAHGASYAALYLFLQFRNQKASSLLKWLSACLMGAAICGMHYTGMAAANFSHDGAVTLDHRSNIDLLLLYSVTAVIFLILLISWGAMFFDRHVLEKMAYRDSLTGLPNRNEMNRYFDTHAGSESVTVLFIDLDQFKAVNDTLGHHVGDALVREVGLRLQRCLAAGQKAFRIGGDEFLFIAQQSSEVRAAALAAQLLQQIKGVFRIEGHDLYMTGSIGISIGPIVPPDRSSLLRQADTAMYKAKKMGKNQYCFYTEEMGVIELRQMELEKDLQRALEHNQLYIVYQPKWNVRTNDLYGFEALIRWQHPRLGLVSPAEFIPIAEETGLILPITRWTIEESCRQCKQWHKEGLQLPVSVNLSVKVFQMDNLFELVSHVLDTTGLSPEWLELEITESMVFHDIQDIIRQLGSIRELGVRISMDDFGTGYSSIGLLDRLPLDALKLDRLFTNDLETPSKRAIINAIVLMAEHLKLDIIAEGVESKEHIDFLTSLGCYIMQGYYYSKPMKEEEIASWIASRHSQTGSSN